MSTDRQRRTRWPRIRVKREENFHFLNCQRFLFPIENFHFLICTDVHVGHGSKPSGRVRLENFHFLICQRFLLPLENFHFLKICPSQMYTLATHPSPSGGSDFSVQVSTIDCSGKGRRKVCSKAISLLWAGHEARVEEFGHNQVGFRF